MAFLARYRRADKLLTKLRPALARGWSIAPCGTSFCRLWRAGVLDIELQGLGGRQGWSLTGSVAGETAEMNSAAVAVR